MEPRAEIVEAARRIAQELEGQIDRHLPSDEHADALLDRIAVLLEVRRLAFEAAVNATAVARSDGRTWAAIATTTGLKYPANAEQQLGAGRERRRSASRRPKADS